MGAFEVISLALAVIEKGKGLYESLRARAAQNGELTPEQEAALDKQADGVFAKWENVPAPPPPVR